jgi:hypothetical protein
MKFKYRLRAAQMMDADTDITRENVHRTGAGDVC